MGTMKLIARNGQELKLIGFREISDEEIDETLKQVKEHWNDKPIKFYDYVGLMKPPVGPIPKSVIEQYEKIASKYGKKIEGINYDECSTG